MANRHGKCIVCGASPTVKMHVFPRAMMFRIRGPDKHLVAGDRTRRGVRYRQSGLWDDRVVCELHERVFGPADDYAIDLCRRIEADARLISSGNAYEIDNPEPNLLLRFVCATIWRQVVCNEGRQLNLDLGPYKQSLEKYLFSNGQVPVQVLIGRANLTAPDGKPLEIAVAPYRARMREWSVWHFTMGPLDVFLKADKRPFPTAWARYLANDNNPLSLIAMDTRRLDQFPILQPIFRNTVRR